MGDLLNQVSRTCHGRDDYFHCLFDVVHDEMSKTIPSYGQVETRGVIANVAGNEWKESVYLSWDGRMYISFLGSSVYNFTYDKHCGTEYIEVDGSSRDVSRFKVYDGGHVPHDVYYQKIGENPNGGWHQLRITTKWADRHSRRVYPFCY